MDASGIAPMHARGAVDDEQLGVRGNQIRRAIRSFDDAYVFLILLFHSYLTNLFFWFSNRRRSDVTNERMPEYHFPSPTSPSFPMVQAPSTRARSPSGTGSAMDDADLEARLRRSVQDGFGEDGGVDAELLDLAERISHARKAPKLKRFGTV